MACSTSACHLLQALGGVRPLLLLRLSLRLLLVPLLLLIVLLLSCHGGNSEASSTSLLYTGGVGLLRR
jgi:hypothetical protein